MKIQEHKLYHDEGTVNGLLYDTVERVVRCKDCKWYRQDIGWCNRNAGTWAADDYCTHAEWRGYDAVD